LKFLIDVAGDDIVLLEAFEDLGFEVIELRNSFRSRRQMKLVSSQPG
jgi:hypothetical protein